MDKELKDFFRDLVEAPSPSGFERPAQEIWRKYVSGFVDKVESDVQGNSIYYTVKPVGLDILYHLFLSSI